MSEMGKKMKDQIWGLDQKFLDFVHAGWKFNYIRPKQELFLKIRFLMANMVKMERGSEMVEVIKTGFKNQQKKFYNLIQDYLLQKAVDPESWKKGKKEIFWNLSCQEMASAYFLLFLSFSAFRSIIDRLGADFTEIVTDAKQEALWNLPSHNDSKTLYIEQRKVEKEFQDMTEEFTSITTQLNSYFTSKIEKNLKRSEQKICNANLVEIHTFQKFMREMFEALEITYKVQAVNARTSFKDTLLLYLKVFCDKKKEQLLTVFSMEQWQESPVSPYFQDVLNAINSMEEQSLWDPPQG